MRPRVLLVEDDADARRSLARALDRDGYDCLPAGGYDEALAQARTGFVDVVVTDVVLGEVDRDGVGLIGALRAAGVRAPVVVITAFADVERTKHALNAGAAYLLEKPFRAPALLAIVARLARDPGDPSFFVDRAFARAGLTDKELAVARLVLKGLTSLEIARLESNSDKTIRQHITRIFAKCGVSSRAELFHFVFPT